MKALLNKKFSLFVFVIFSLFILPSVNATQNEDSPSDIHNLINQADSLFSRTKIDSCLVLYKVVLEKMKGEYSESDSLYLHVIS